MSERYPQARRMELTENIGGHRVSDPYRWLEDDTSGERADWLTAQADLFGSYREETARPGAAGRPGTRAAAHRLRGDAGLAGRALFLHPARP